MGNVMTQAEAQSMIEDILAYERGNVLVLDEAVAPKAIEPIMARAAGVELAPKDSKRLAKEFIAALREEIQGRWEDELLMDPVVSKSKKETFEDSDAEGLRAATGFEAPRELTATDEVSLDIPAVVDRMPSAKRILGMSGVMALRQGLARALMSDRKLAQRLITQAFESSIGSLTFMITEYVRYDALSDMLWDLMRKTIWVDPAPLGYENRQDDLAHPDFNKLQLTMKRFSVNLANGSKFKKNPRGEGIPVVVKSAWDVRGKITFEFNWDDIYFSGRGFPL